MAKKKTRRQRAVANANKGSFTKRKDESEDSEEEMRQENVVHGRAQGRSNVGQKVKVKDQVSMNGTKSIGGTKPKGLMNLGNTCFFNSVMQNLCRTPGLVQALQKAQQQNSMTVKADNAPILHIKLQSLSKLSQALLNFLVTMNTDEAADNGNNPKARKPARGKAENPRELFNQICAVCPRFRGYQQQDSQELLRTLLDGIKNEEIRRRKQGILAELNLINKKARDIMDPDLKEKVKQYGKDACDQDTIVDRLFSGTLVSSVLCDECGRITQVTEEFLDISLPIVDVHQPHDGARKTQKTRSAPEKGDNNSGAEEQHSSTTSKHARKKLRKETKKGRKQGRNRKTSETNDATVSKAENLHDTTPCNGATAASNDGDVSPCLKSDHDTNGSVSDDTMPQVSSMPHNGNSTPSKADSENYLISRLNNLNLNEDNSSGLNCDINGFSDNPSFEKKAPKEEMVQVERARSFDIFNDVTFRKVEATVSSMVSDILQGAFREIHSGARKNSDEIRMDEILGECENVSKENGVKCTEKEFFETENLATEEGMIESETADYGGVYAEVAGHVVSTAIEAATLELSKKVSSDKKRTPKNEMGDTVGERTSIKGGIETPFSEISPQFLAENKTGDEFSHSNSPVENTSDNIQLRPIDKENPMNAEEKLQLNGGTEERKEGTKRLKAEKKVTFQEPTSTGSEPTSGNDEKELSGSGAELGSKRTPSSLFDTPAKQPDIKFKDFCCKLPTTLSPRYEPKKQECSLQSCLHKFTMAEMLTGNNKYGCEGCTERQARGKEKPKTVYCDASKQMLIKQAPLILTLHLKRFQQTGKSLRKFSKPVEIPVLFDLGPFCSNDARNQADSNNEIMYRLFGIVEHYGSLSRGHYTAYVNVRAENKDILRQLNPEMNGHNGVEDEEDPAKNEGDWFHISDTAVSKCTLDRALNSNAYLIFYERIFQ